MDKENQVASYGLSIKLKDKNVLQESIWHWVKDMVGHPDATNTKRHLKIRGAAGRDYRYPVSAFTVSELGEKLPSRITFGMDDGKRRGYDSLYLQYGFTLYNEKIRHDVYYRPFVSTKTSGEPKTFIYWEQGVTEADARAKMILSLYKDFPYMMSKNIIGGVARNY